MEETTAPKEETIKNPVKTGELHVQFDNDDSIKVADIMDKNTVNIQLKYDDNNRSHLIFKGKDNKTFKLFIKNV